MGKNNDKNRKIKTKKRHRGRPTKYKYSFTKEVEKYYQECLLRNTMPFLEDLALLFKVDEDTITNWKKKYKDFFGAIARINILQKKYLKKITIGNYNGAIFLLKANHGMVETQHLQLTGKEGEEPITLVVSRMPEEIEKNNKPI